MGKRLSSKPVSAQPHRLATNPTTYTFAQKYGDAKKCVRCGNSVNAAEKIIGAGNPVTKTVSNVPSMERNQQL